MLNEENVSRHYQNDRLLESIKIGLEKLGKDINSITIEDLAPVDEFHIGGRVATEHLLAQLNLSPKAHVLDIGCGIGGASRFTAKNYMSTVSGIDLTQEFIKTGQALCDWTGLENQINLSHNSALLMPFKNQLFDAAYMIHVGMNIDNKTRLFKEIHRVLQPGAKLGIYDVMQTGEGSLNYPVPWADSHEISALASIDEYKGSLLTSGFTILDETNRRQFSLDFFKEYKARMAAQSEPPALGLHLVMGESLTTKMQNVLASISNGHIAPIELIVEKQ